MRAAVEGLAKAGGAGGFSGGYHGCGRGARAGCCCCVSRCSALGTPAASAAAAAASPMPTVVDSASSVYLHRAMGSGGRGCCARFPCHGGCWVVLPWLWWAGLVVYRQRHGPPVARRFDPLPRPLRWPALLVGSQRRRAPFWSCSSLRLAGRSGCHVDLFLLFAGPFFCDVHSVGVGRVNGVLWLAVYTCKSGCLCVAPVQSGVAPFVCFFLLRLHASAR